MPQIAQPKHFIYGKWKSFDQDSTVAPTFILEFRDNNLLIVQTVTTENKVFTDEYFYKIIDDATVDFFYTETINKERISVLIKAKNNSEIDLVCYKTDKSKDIRGILDQPKLCFYHDFRKIV